MDNNESDKEFYDRMAKRDTPKIHAEMIEKAKKARSTIKVGKVIGLIFFLLMVAVGYGILTFVAWDYSPATWNWLERLIAFVWVLWMGIGTISGVNAFIRKQKRTGINIHYPYMEDGTPDTRILDGTSETNVTKSSFQQRLEALAKERGYGKN